MLKRTIFLLLFIFSFFQSQSQEQIGLRMENYSGVNANFINPANSTSSFLKFDVNIGSGGFFLENNLLYLSNSNLLSILKNPNEISTNLDVLYLLSDSFMVKDKSINYLTNIDSKRHFESSIYINGPSVHFKFNEHGLGLFTNFRSAISAKDFDEILNIPSISELENGATVTIPKFHVGMALWSEIGINYSYGLDTWFGNFDMGINLKLLQGYDGAYFNNVLDVKTTPQSDGIYKVYAPNIDIGFTDNILALSNGKKYNFQKNGMGTAFDIGFNIRINQYSNSKKYKYKIGAALLDIGGINFTQNGNRQSFRSQLLKDIDSKKILDNFELTKALEEFSLQIYGDPKLSSLPIKTFKVALPAALSVNADVQLIEGAYISALWQQRIYPYDVLVGRGNMIAITPRYEHRWFSASIPFSLYEYQKFRIGAALRLGWIIIGSENLASIFGSEGDMTGTDFYFGTKFNFINSDGNRAKTSKNLGCFDF